MNDPIITEDNPQPFIVRVKLLTNEVHDFVVDKNMKVAEFKTLISPKVNVPVDRMRIVFAGRQLMDDKPLSEYVNESGMVVHLIARTAPPSEQPQPQNTQPVNNPQPAQTPPRNPEIPPNPFGDIMGMMGSLFGGAQNGNNPPPQITMSFGGSNAPLSGLLGSLGSLGVRFPVPPPTQQQPPAQQVTQQNPPTQRAQSSQPSNTRISYNQIGQLNQSLNNLNIPLDNVTSTNQNLTPEGVIRYLRRLHHQSSRSMLQLNRLLNIAETNNNNTSLLSGFIPVLQSLNSANSVAITCLTEINQRNNNQPTSNNSNSTSNQPQQVPSSTQSHPSSSQASNEQSRQQQPQPQVQQPHSQQSQQSARTTPPPIPQMASNMAQNFNPMQMMQGLDLGSLMGGLSSVGGINGLFGMTLKEMMSESGSQPTGIFLGIFGGMTGQNMMQMFTTKDFRFLNEKHSEIRQALKTRIQEKSEEEVVNEITNESSNVLVPSRPHPMIPDIQSCKSKCFKNLKKHVQQLVKISLSENDNEYYLKVTGIAKSAFCENVQIISKHTNNNNESVAFEIIKSQTLAVLDPVLPGISGLFYSLIQRDLFRIYQEFKAEEERRNQMSEQESKSEQKLIQMIKEVGAKDSDSLAQTKHSKSYYQ